MINQSRISHRAGSYRRIMIAFLMLVVFSATIAALAYRTCAPASLTLNSVALYGMCVKDKWDIREIAENTLSALKRKLPRFRAVP
jgi:hypothetical protein